MTTNVTIIIANTTIAVQKEGTLYNPKKYINPTRTKLVIPIASILCNTLKDFLYRADKINDKNTSPTLKKSKGLNIVILSYAPCDFDIPFLTCVKLTIPQDKCYIVPFITVLYIHMPKAGFKSITVSENVYKKFYDVYEKSRKELELKGITSFSGYLTSMMEEMMIKYEAFAKHAPFIQKIAIDQNRVILKDNKCNRIVEVLLKDRELQCLLDEKSDCVHVGFVYSLPELYSIISSKSIKVPRRVQ